MGPLLSQQLSEIHQGYPWKIPGLPCLPKPLVLRLNPGMRWFPSALYFPLNGLLLYSVL